MTEKRFSGHKIKISVHNIVTMAADTVGDLDLTQLSIQKEHRIATDEDASISNSLVSDENTTGEKKGRNPDRKRHGARNQHKMKDFVKWLLATFPDTVATSRSTRSSESDDTTTTMAPTHILDVAGGKGELAARLCMCHLTSVVMVDPRPADVAHCYESLVLPKIPKKWQQRLEERRASNPQFVEEMVQERFRQLVMPMDDHTLATSTELQEAVRDARLLVGMHADGATEAIIDAALLYKKPFVVVPCCVFPNLFQERRVSTDEGNTVPVRSHEQFCRYLQEKDARFQRCILPFEGRNIAIWWDGQS
jgi:hypothetical protein